MFKRIQREVSNKMKGENEGADREGFLCPVCMTPMASADDLQLHYIQQHENNPDISAPAGDASVDSGVSAVADELHDHQVPNGSASEAVPVLTAEIRDLRASLKEERWFSAELKKELEKLQVSISEHQAAAAGEGENEYEYYLQQIQALEAGKTLIAAQMLSMEKDLKEERRINVNIAQERDSALRKAAEISRQAVKVKAQQDEDSDQKLVLGDENVRLRDKLRSLSTQLDSRPSEDDVSVLKKELVHAQQLMDDMTREREVELATWKSQCDVLAGQCKDHEEVVKSLTDELDSLRSSQGDSVASTSALVENLKSQIEKLQQEQGSVQTSLETERRRMETMETELSGARGRNTDLQAQLNAAQQAEVAARTSLESYRSSAAHNSEELVQKCAAAETAAASASLTLLQKEGEISDLNTELASIRDLLQTTKDQMNSSANQSKQALEDKDAQLSKTTGQLAQLQASVDTKTKELSGLREEVLRKDTRVAELQAQAKEAQVKLIEAERSLDTVSLDLATTKSNVDSLTTEKTEASKANEAALLQLESLKTQLEQQSSTAAETSRDLQQRIVDLQAANEASCSQIAEISAEIGGLQKQRDSAQAELDGKRKELQDLLLSNEKSKSDMEKLLKTVTSEKTAAETMLRECRESTDDQIKVLKATLEKEKFERNEEKRAATTQLQTLKAEKTLVEEQTATVKMQHAKLESELADMRHEVLESRREAEDARNDKEELDSQLTAWKDEKRMLVEKCLAMEHELSQQQTTVKDWRTKHEDMLAAVHELGREHQAMQIDLRKQQTRKWVDDKSAVDCAACGKEFSVTIRKHHCRHCGHVFCAECTNRTATVAASKKPVRVCDNCHKELQTS